MSNFFANLLTLVFTIHLNLQLAVIPKLLLTNMKYKKTLVGVFVALFLVGIIYTFYKISAPVFKIFSDIKKIENLYTITENEFVVVDPPGQKRTININDGKTYVLHFWATWCKPCISEFDEFEKYKSKFGDVELLFISVENPEKVKDFLKDKTWQLNFYTCDTLQLHFQPKEIEFYPTNITIERGKIISAASGPVSWKDL